MNDLTIFNNKAVLPSYEQEDCDSVSLSSGMASGVKFIRLDGKEFVMVDGGVKSPVGKELIGVIINAGPLSKRFYANAFTGKDTHAPDCASADGKIPDTAVTNPVCDNCEMCPNNAWGSKAGYTGKKAKLCQEYRRLVFCLTDEGEHTLYRLDIPAASLNNLRVYGSLLKMRRVPLAAVITKITFDPQMSYQKLKFDAWHPFTKEEFMEYKALGNSEESLNILQMQVSAEVDDAESEDEDDEQDQPAPARPRKVVKKSKKMTCRPKQTKKVDEEVEEVEEDDEPAEVVTPKRKKKVTTKMTSMTKMTSSTKPKKKVVLKQVAEEEDEEDDEPIEAETAEELEAVLDTELLEDEVDE